MKRIPTAIAGTAIALMTAVTLTPAAGAAVVRGQSTSNPTAGTAGVDRSPALCHREYYSVNGHEYSKLVCVTGAGAGDPR